MSRPIEATPPITGKAAERFLQDMEAAVMTPERLAWLRSVAEQSQRAEHGNQTGEVEALAEKLHREFRGAFKALHHICAGFEHDHGWEHCHKKEYFVRRAQRWLEGKQ
jgi:hypothetical protein